MSDPGVVRLGGEEFKAAEVPLMSLMRFAHVAQSGEANEMEQWAAIYDLCEVVIDPEDWDRFQKVAIRAKASDKDLMLLVRKVIRGETDRPTSRPSDSSDGPTSTEPNSVDDSSSPVAEEAEEFLRVARHWEEKGRPDVAYMVRLANGRAPSPV